jgi:hypothetical protein
MTTDCGGTLEPASKLIAASSPLAQQRIGRLPFPREGLGSEVVGKSQDGWVLGAIAAMTALLTFSFVLESLQNRRLVHGFRRRPACAAGRKHGDAKRGALQLRSAAT